VMRRLLCIKDQFTDLPLLKQWKYNLRIRRLRLCWSCSATPPENLIKGTGDMMKLARYLDCLEKARDKQRLRRERLRTNGTIPPTTRARQAPQSGLTSAASPPASLNLRGGFRQFLVSRADPARLPGRWRFSCHQR
jgi:hypothetical protein